MAHPVTKDIAVSAKGEDPLYETIKKQVQKGNSGFFLFFFFVNKLYKSQEASELNKF